MQTERRIVMSVK